MNQSEQVINTMRALGGYATFEQLNKTLDFSCWKTKTPEASVRRIVQQSDAFFRIQPGLWALEECRSEVEKKLKISSRNAKKQEYFSHSYFQGLLVMIGNSRNFETWIPNQDKNKFYLETSLSSLCSIKKDFFDFSYPCFVKRAKTIDVIWFNNRKMPYAFFEVEHTTDISHSLLKFNELQDFYANFYIVANQSREHQFNDILTTTYSFQGIRNRVHFLSYQQLTNDFDKDLKQHEQFNYNSL